MYLVAATHYRVNIVDEVWVTVWHFWRVKIKRYKLVFLTFSAVSDCDPFSPKKWYITRHYIIWHIIIVYTCILYLFSMFADKGFKCVFCILIILQCVWLGHVYFYVVGFNDYSIRSILYFNWFLQQLCKVTGRLWTTEIPDLLFIVY